LGLYQARRASREQKFTRRLRPHAWQRATGVKSEAEIILRGVAKDAHRFRNNANRGRRTFGDECVSGHGDEFDKPASL